MANHFKEKIVEEETPTQQGPTPQKNETVNEQEKSNEQTSTEEKKKSSSNKFNERVFHFFGGDILKDKWVIKQIPLILLILLYGILLVANRYYVEKLTKEKMKLTDQVEYLREHQIQMQKNYQESIKISQIAKSIDSLGIGLTAGPPYEL